MGRAGGYRSSLRWRMTGPPIVHSAVFLQNLLGDLLIKIYARNVCRPTSVSSSQKHRTAYGVQHTLPISSKAATRVGTSCVAVGTNRPLLRTVYIIRELLIC